MSGDDLRVWVQAGTYRRGLVWMAAEHGSREANPPAAAKGLLVGLDPGRPSVAWSCGPDGTVVVAAGFRSWRRQQVSGHAFWRLVATGVPGSSATRILAANLLRDVTDELNACGARPDSAAGIVDAALADGDALSFRITDPELPRRLASLSPTLGPSAVVSAPDHAVDLADGADGVRYGLNDTDHRRKLQNHLETDPEGQFSTVAATFVSAPAALCRPGTWLLTPSGRRMQPHIEQRDEAPIRGLVALGDSVSQAFRSWRQNAPQRLRSAHRGRGAGT